MSGTVGVTPVSPSFLDTNDYEDNQPPGSIQPPQLRQLIDSLSGISVTSQTTSYTYVAGDRFTIVRYNSASSGVFTIPNNSTVAFPVGVMLGFRQVGTGALTIAGAGGVILNIPAGLSIVQWSTGWVHQELPNVWVMMS